jgi:serine/alanine adding enzyme
LVINSLKNHLKIITDPTKINRDSWDEFILNHKDGNIFQSSKYYDSLLNTELYNPLFIACTDDVNSNLCGLIVGVIQSDHRGLLGFFTRRCIIVGGPIVSKENDEIIYNLLLRELKNQLKWKVLFTQFQFFIKPESKIFDIYINYGYYYEDYLNILVDTTIGKEELWKGVKRNRKDGINKGNRQNYQFSVVVSEAAISVFYSLLVKMYKRIKKPIPPKNHFDALQSNLNSGQMKFFQLAHEDQVVISLLCFHDKSRLYAYYVGIAQDEKLLNLKPVDYFYWQVILWCHENGINYFDWMGAGKKSEKYGVRDFKLQYGGELFENGRMSKFSNKYIGAVIKFLLKIYWRKK